MPAVVDASNVDFSERLTSKRKSYKTTSRRRRILEDGTEELGDLSDEDGTVSLARRIARLKREIEEARQEYEKQKNAAATTAEEGKGVLPVEVEDQIDSLSKALDEISKLEEPLSPPGTILPAPKPPAPSTTDEGTVTATVTTGTTYTITYSPTYDQTHALAKAADFDRRLLILERALGIGSVDVPGLTPDNLPRAVIPLLEQLHKQITTLSEASVPTLDGITRRVRTLTQETENLEKARRSAKATQEAIASAGGNAAAAGTGTEGAGVSPETAEQMAKINALYGTLPTIESLAPLLPPLLDRLRSLRMIHAEAATAAETLARIEKRQAEMAAEIQQWREGLEKVEAAVREGDATMSKNVGVMEGWVKALEESMAKLSGWVGGCR